MSYLKSPRKITPPALYTLLQADTTPPLGNLMRQVHFLADLARKLESFLGAPLNRHCVLANYTANTLVLHSDSSAWASRLRYLAPRIKEFMQNECALAGLQTIRIKVSPAPGHTQRSNYKRLLLDRHVSAVIRQSALSVTDEKLRNLLLEISTHTHN